MALNAPPNIAWDAISVGVAFGLVIASPVPNIPAPAAALDGHERFSVGPSNAPVTAPCTACLPGLRDSNAPIVPKVAALLAAPPRWFSHGYFSARDAAASIGNDLSASMTPGSFNAPSPSADSPSPKSAASPSPGSDWPVARSSVCKSP